MTDELGFDQEVVNDLLRQAREKDRGYASYWKWEINRPLEEGQVARTLLTYLERNTNWSVASLRKCEIDPPDCAATLTDGRVVGIEVTELVDECLVKRHAMRRSAEREVRTPSPKAAESDEVALWTTERLRKAVRGIVARKDVAAKGGPFNAYFVAIFTDETMITPDVLHGAIGGIIIKTEHLDDAYVLFSYHPDAEPDYPGGILIMKLPVQREVTA